MKDRIMVSNQSEQQTESQIGEKNIESNIRDLWDNIKCASLHIIRVLEGEERERRTENVFEKIVAENFPNVIKEMYSDTGSTEGSKQDEPKQTYTKTC